MSDLFQITPGEWMTIAPARQGKHWLVAVPGVTPDGRKCSYIIARIDNGAPGDTLETEGWNAKAIAAIPTMLAAMQEALTDLRAVSEPGGERSIAALRDAFRKAGYSDV